MKSRRKKQEADRCPKRATATARPPGRVLTQAGDAQVVEFKDAMDLYLAGQYDRLSEWLLTILSMLSNTMGSSITASNQKFLDSFVENLLFFFTKKDYEIRRDYAKYFLEAHPVITNCVAISHFRNTDPQIEVLLRQPNSLSKILPLYSPRNTVKIDRPWLFEQDPELASMWYGSYYKSAPCPWTKTIYENMREHQAHVDDRLQISDSIGVAYLFHTPYVSAQTERPIKERVNQLIREKLQHIAIRNSPKPNRIAVLTGSWAVTTSAVCRAYARYVEALAGRYSMTLIHLAEPTDDLDARPFDDVRHIRFEDGEIRGLEAVTDNDFQMAFYPDVGMTNESIYLSNLRIAPIQVMAYGHPTSTWGSQIDYFLGGADVEIVEDAKKNYSERLVLLPGLGASLSLPNYQPTRPPTSSDRTVITCAWNAGKCNYPMLIVLGKILQRTEGRSMFQFLPTFRDLGFFPLFQREVTALLGKENVDILSTGTAQSTGENTYMQRLEQGDLSIDSFPFGSATSVLDALYVGKPMVAWAGTKPYSLAASFILRKLGLAELVATNEEEFVNIVCRLADDTEYRNDLGERILELDLDAHVRDPDGPKYFKKAIDFLIENHESLRRDGSADPIVIGPT